jgi:hypothetical protein
MSNAAAVPACAICGKPVSLESAKADENGKTVHEKCYVLKVKRRQGISLARLAMPEIV